MMYGQGQGQGGYGSSMMGGYGAGWMVDMAGYGCRSCLSSWLSGDQLHIAQPFQVQIDFDVMRRRVRDRAPRCADVLASFEGGGDTPTASMAVSTPRGSECEALMNSGAEASAGLHGLEQHTRNRCAEGSDRIATPNGDCRRVSSLNPLPRIIRASQRGVTLAFAFYGRFVCPIPMRSLLWSLWLGVSISICAQTADPAEGKEGSGKPALIATADLAGYEALPEDRRKLIRGAIAVARDSPWLRYTTRGADPSKGGFDCSGAMFFVLRKAGLEPPRTAAEQLRWLKSNQRLHEVPRDAVDVEHPSFKKLRPGDLLFWGTPGSAEDGAKVNITHVAMYLGAEKRDGRPVMINSTDGRSYRGTKANGYGVYDFRLPRAGAKVAFIGYGTPPGIAEMPDAQRAAWLHVSADDT